ncbi:hypothetical protein SERLADRAFT_477608, partial [Serpula lacrymans var. lacrymans S7.9]
MIGSRNLFFSGRVLIIVSFYGISVIVKHGGTLLPLYNPEEVTHIVTDANTRPTLRALGLKSLTGIPDHIPTVKWSWVISGLGRLGIHKASGN